MKVYLVIKHGISTYSCKNDDGSYRYDDAGIILGVFSDKSDADNLVSKKQLTNTRGYYKYKVIAKVVK